MSGIKEKEKNLAPKKKREATGYQAGISNKREKRSSEKDARSL